MAYRVIEDIVVFNRQYKAGHDLSEEDIETWDVPPEEAERELGRLRGRGQIEEAEPDGHDRAKRGHPDHRDHPRAPHHKER